ncbi:hypothetical protein QWA68_006231 [Fusarium oxysporum]|nr:hypothetical protein QWA68_006231 [Fusarium oxysporum]
MTCSSSSRASGQQSPDLLLPLVHVRHEAEPVTGSSGVCDSHQNILDGMVDGSSRWLLSPSFFMPGCRGLY